MRRNKLRQCIRSGILEAKQKFISRIELMKFKAPAEKKMYINFMHKIMQSYSLFTVSSLCFLIKVEEENEDNTRKIKRLGEKR